METKISLVPPGSSLMPHQAVAVKRMIKDRLAGYLIFDPMGLGKTIEAIAMCNYWGHITRKKESNEVIIVVCPPIVIRNWQREFKKWDVFGRDIEIVTSGKHTFGDSHVYIVSDALLANPNMCAKLVSLAPTVVIGDEAHRYKNWKSKRCKAFYKLLGRKTKRILLTGTPIIKSVMDLHPLLVMAQPGKWPNYKDFGSRYSNLSHNGFALEYKGTKNVAELKQKMSEITIRRSKKEVLPDLPDKIFSTIPVSLDDQELCEKSLKYTDYATYYINGGRDGHRTTEDDECLMTIKRLVGQSKVGATCEFLDTFPEDEKIVVGTCHRDVLDAIVSDLSDRGKSVCSISGSTPKDVRQENIDAFQRGEYQFIVCNIVAAGVGITLTRASVCVFAELDWTPANMAQFVDRLHRIGQKKCVNVYSIVGENSLDDRIIDLLTEKIKLIQEVI